MRLNKNNNNGQNTQSDNLQYDSDVSVQSSLKPCPNLSSLRSFRTNPVPVFERLAVAEHFEYERINENELHLSLVGNWCLHDISLVWNNADERLDLYLLLEGHTPQGRSDEMRRLITLINERLSYGRFDYWSEKRALVYRDQINLSGGAKLVIEQAMSLLSGALEAAERGYPAVQYVIWAGKTPEEALDAALMDIAVNV